MVKENLVKHQKVSKYYENDCMSRHGYKYIKYKKCVSEILPLCIKQHLSKVWSSIHEEVKQHWGWVEKSVAYKKSV